MKTFLSWSNFKIEVRDKPRLRFEERDGYYILEYRDTTNNDCFESSIEKDSGSDQTDFETNYKSLANKSAPAQIIDSDGALLSRIRVTAAGWQYQFHGIEFKSSQLDSVYSKKEDGTDFGFATVKCYDSDDVQLTTQGDCDTSSVKTVLDWEPTHDYEIIGGLFKQLEIPATNIRMWVVGVPDVSEANGGSKPFMANINLRYVGLEEGTRIDGRAAKFLAYNATYHTNKIRIILKHSAGYKHDIHMIMEIFKA